MSHIKSNYNITEFFNEKIGAAIRGNPTKASEVNSLFLFKITGENGGNWSVNLSSRQNGPWIKPEISENPNCTVEISADDLIKLLQSNNSATAVQMYYEGKLKLQGELAASSRLQKLLNNI